MSTRAVQEGSVGDTAAQSGQGDEGGGEGDDCRETQDDSLADEILSHVARLLLYAVTWRQIVFQCDGTAICLGFVLVPVCH